MVDYKKWDTLNLDEEDANISSNHTNSISKDENDIAILNQCQSIKLHVDRLLNEAEQAKTPNLDDYITAICGYESIIHQLTELNINSIETIDSSLKTQSSLTNHRVIEYRLVISSFMNIICCHARLNHWDQVILHSSNTESYLQRIRQTYLLSPPINQSLVIQLGENEVFSTNDEIRLRYFKCTAYTNLYEQTKTKMETENKKSLMTAEKLLENAIEQSRFMMVLIDQTSVTTSTGQILPSIDSDMLNDYYSLFHRLQTVSSHTIPKSKSMIHSKSLHVSEKETEHDNRKKSLGWDCLERKLDREAIVWFSDQLSSKANDGTMEGILRAAELFEGQAEAFLGVGDKQKAALSFVECGGRYAIPSLGEDTNKKAIIPLLRASDLYIESKEFNKTYKCSQQVFDLLNTVNGKNDSNLEKGSSSSSKTIMSTITTTLDRNDILYLAIARYGIGISSIVSNRSKISSDTVKKAIEYLAVASDIFSELLPPMESISPTIDVTTGSCAIRLVYCYQYISIAYEILSQPSDAIQLIDSKLLPLLQSIQRYPVPSDMLRRINRCFAEALLSKANNLLSIYSVENIESMKEIVTVYRQAGDFFSKERLSILAYDAYRSAATELSKFASVSPYALDSLDNPSQNPSNRTEYAEEAYEIWKSVAKEANRVLFISNTPSIGTTDTTDTIDTIEWKINHSLSLYQCGLCAMRYDMTLAIRSFESSLSNNLDQNNLDDCLRGDVDYHLSYSYLRIGNNSQALDQIIACDNFFQIILSRQSIDNRSISFDWKSMDSNTMLFSVIIRMRHIVSLKVIILSSLMRIEDAQKEIQRLRRYYVSPSNECEEEIIRLNRIVDKYRIKSKLSTNETTKSHYRPQMIDPNNTLTSRNDSHDYSNDNRSNSRNSNVITKPPMAIDDKMPAINSSHNRKDYDNDITFYGIVERILSILSRRFCRVLFNRFKVYGVDRNKNRNGNRSRHPESDYEWDYNLISAYAILAAVGSVCLAIFIPLVIEMIKLYRSNTNTVL